MAKTNEMVTVNEPDSAAAEAFRALRTNITMRDFDKKIKMINVISANAQESKSTTVLNLAYVYSQLGKSVLVIDMDLRLPSVHKKIGVRNKCGLTDVISGQAEFADCLEHFAPNMDVLLSGTKIPFTSEFVQSGALKEFLNKIRSRYDFILIDCPPINLVTDGLIASSYCDGTLLCIASNSDEKRDLERAKDLLDQMNVNVLGIVMTRMPVAKKYYHYNYSYGYHKDSSSSSEKKKRSLFGNKEK